MSDLSHRHERDSFTFIARAKENSNAPGNSLKGYLMARFTWIFMALIGLTFAGCGPADNNATAPAGDPPVETEEALGEAGMEGISAEDYNNAGATPGQ